MAILWLLLLAFKDLEKSLLLSGREEEIIESYLNRGDKKMKFVIAIVGLCVFLVGCGGGAGYSSSSAPQEHPLDVVTETFSKCGMYETKRIKPDYRDEVIVTGPTDPEYVKKITSTRKIEDDYKQYLINGTPIRQRCQSEFLTNVARYSQYHVPGIIAGFNELDFLVIEVITGKIKTFGEYNSVYQRVEQKINTEWVRASIELNKQSQQELAARRAQALQGLQVLNALQQQQQQVSNDWIKSMSPQQASPNIQYTPPVVTNCDYMGDSLMCSSGRIGEIDRSNTTCDRIGDSISCTTW